MHFGEDVTVAVRHHRIDGLPRTDLFAADDDGDFDLPAAEVSYGLLQLGAFP
jgi:hypothetical protein